MSALVAWNIVAFETLGFPIALLMGGSVVGIANKCQTLGRKIAVITIGMPAAFVLVTNLTKITVLIELVLLLIIAYKLFVRGGSDSDNKHTHELEEQMKQCC